MQVEIAKENLLTGVSYELTWESLFLTEESEREKITAFNFQNFLKVSKCERFLYTRV